MSLLIVFGLPKLHTLSQSCLKNPFHTKILFLECATNENSYSLYDVFYLRLVGGIIDLRGGGSEKANCLGCCNIGRHRPVGDF